MRLCRLSLGSGTGKGTGGWLGSAVRLCRLSLGSAAGKG